MIPIAAEGVTVLQIDISCIRMGKQGNTLKDCMKQKTATICQVSDGRWRQTSGRFETDVTMISDLTFVFVVVAHMMLVERQ